MGHFLVVWVIRPIVGVLIGQIFLQTLRLCGSYPDRYVAQKVAAVIQQPPADLMLGVQLMLTILFGAVALIIYEFVMRRWVRVPEIKSGNIKVTGRQLIAAVLDQPTPENTKISLIDAARRAYSETEGTTYAMLGERVSGKGIEDGAPDDVLNCYAQGIVRYSTVWGQKEPSDTTRPQDLSEYDLERRNGGFIARKDKWIIGNLMVSQSDLAAFIERVRKYPEEPI